MTDKTVTVVEVYAKDMGCRLQTIKGNPLTRWRETIAEAYAEWAAQHPVPAIE